MKKSDLLILFIGGLAVGLIMLYLRPYTGYMDADYYYAMARQLFLGHGINQNFLWNYLDDPIGLPHTAFTYWMPLSSLLSTLEMQVFHNNGLTFARIPFVLLFAFVPVMTAQFGYVITKDRFLSIISGSIALFAGYYLRFITEPDSFSILMVLGTSFLLILTTTQGRWKDYAIPLLLGLTAGLIHLSRADGLIWLAVGILFTGSRKLFSTPQEEAKQALGWMKYQKAILSTLLVIFGYLVVMFPWYLRNILDFHSIFPPGNFRTALLTEYDQMFSYPASSITLTNWLNQGLGRIVGNIISAIGTNLLTAIVIQGNIVMLPFAIIGLIRRRKEIDVQVIVTAWIMIFIAMSFVFPFAGRRGGYLHSIAALQPAIWVYSISGLKIVIDWAAKIRNWDKQIATKLFSLMFIGIAIAISIFVVISDQRNGGKAQAAVQWNDYSEVDEFIKASGKLQAYSVMVNNPPAYSIATDQQSYMIPFGDNNSILNLSKRFCVQYLVLDENHIKNYDEIYDHPRDQVNFKYLGTIKNYHIYRIIQ